MEPSYVLLGVTNGDQLGPNLTLGQYLTKLKAGIEPKIQVSIGGNIDLTAQAELKRLGVGYLPTLELLDKQFKEFLN
jgi:hypothetical protein